MELGLLTTTAREAQDSGGTLRASVSSLLTDDRVDQLPVNIGKYTANNSTQESRTQSDLSEGRPFDNSLLVTGYDPHMHLGCPGCEGRRQSNIFCISCGRGRCAVCSRDQYSHCGRCGRGHCFASGVCVNAIRLILSHSSHQSPVANRFA